MKFIYKSILLLVLLLTFFSCVVTPDMEVKIDNLQKAVDDTKVGTVLDLSKYKDIKKFTATIDKKITIKGVTSVSDFKKATITINCSDVTLQNIKNVNVVVNDKVKNGNFTSSNCSFTSLELYGCGIDSGCVTLRNTTISDCYIYKQTDENNKEYLGIDIDKKTVIDKITMADSCVAIFSSEDCTADRVKDVVFGSVSSGNSANIAFGSNIQIHRASAYCVASFYDSSFASAYVHPEVNICVAKGDVSSKVTKSFFKQAAKFILGNVNNGSIDDSNKFNEIIDADCSVDINKMVDAITVTFNGNGATNTMDEIKVIANGLFKLPKCSFIKDGFAFSKWEEIGNIENKIENQAFVKFSKNTELKALWLESFDITYIDRAHPCDCWKAGYEPKLIFTEQDEVILPTTLDLSRDGYEFIGWYNTPDFNGDICLGWKPGEKTEDVTLYAKWNYIAKVSDVKIINGDRHLVVCWKNPDSSDLKKVKILCNDEPKEFDGCVQNADMSCDFTGLTNGALYSFEIVVVDKDGMSSDAIKRNQYCGNFFDTDGNIVIKGVKYEKTGLVDVPGVTIDGTSDVGVFVTGRKITLSPYSIGQYEVTRELYTAVMGKDNSTYTSNALLPVQNVTMLDAVTFCETLTDWFGFDSCYDVTYDCIVDKDGFRLPTEAEWECAARGGDPTAATWYNMYSGSNILDDFGWYDSNSNKKMQVVGKKSPNTLNIYDLSGNVWEWCADVYTTNLPKGELVNPVVLDGNQFVARGGSIINLAQDCSVITRSKEYVGLNNKLLGFRIARSK